MMGYLLVSCFLLLSFTRVLTAEYPSTYPSKEERKVAFACQDSYIHLSCKDPSKRIRILLANYGRFSLVVCNQDGIHKGWNVQCSSKISMEVVRERCDNRTRCTFQASNSLFGDPCPDTKKYIEVRYFCEGAKEVKTDPTYSVITSTTSKPTTTTSAEDITTEEEKHTGGHTEKWNNEKHCKEERVKGVLWQKTSAGEVKVTDCPADMRGTATWKCGRNGKWVGQPDLTDCVSVWMDEVHTMLEKEVSPQVVISNLNKNLKGKVLGPGDLKQASNNILPGLVSKMKKEMQKNMPKEVKKEKVHSFTKEMVKSGSGLLNNTQQASWRDLQPEQRKKSATSLIVSLEQMALEVAATIDKYETVASAEQNIVMEVSVIKMSRKRTDLKLPIMQYDQGPTDGYHDFSLPLDGVTGLTSTDDVTVTYLFYNNLDVLMSPQNENSGVQTRNSSLSVNTNIIAASMMKHSSTVSKPHGRTELKRPMTFKLSHKNMLRDQAAVCAYWKYNASSLIGEWSEDGCYVVEASDEFTTCQCDHLTNFAVLMDVTGTKLHKWHRMSLQAITYVGCSVSIICLIMCFISFSIFRNLQSDRNTIHKNLVLCLMVAELLFLFGIGQTQDRVLCSVVAGFLHFFFLTSFAWMCLEGIQLYFMLIEVFEAERSRVRWFYAFGYGIPALIVGISAAIDHTGYGTENHCWLRTDNYFILSFVIPAAIVVLINIVMLSIAIYMMCRHAGVTASSIQARKKGKLEKMGNGSGKNSVVSDTSTAVDLPTWLKGSAVLVVLLGLTWTFGFLYLSEDMVVIAYIFTILNSLQGLFIFIFHCFMDRKVKKEWRRAIYKAKWLPICCRVNIGGYNGNLSSPPTSSSGPQNYFLKFWSSRKRKRSTSSSGTAKNRRSDLDSFLRSDVSSGTTTGTGVNRYSNQSDKLLPNGQNIYSAMPTHYEDGVAGDLSVVDASVIDSEYVTEYCQQNMQVSKEKRRYSSGSENSGDEGQNDNISHDGISKDGLSNLSADSNMKLHSEFTSEEGKINYAVLEEGENKAFLQENDNIKTESERNMLNDLLSMYQNTKDKNGIQVPNERICTSEEVLDSQNTCVDNDKVIAKSAPNLECPTNSCSNQSMDSSTHPLLGSLPNLSTIREEDGEGDPCSKSAHFGTSQA